MAYWSKLPTTLGLLQGWLDIGAMVILSLLCFIWAGRTLLGFCLLTCTFISLISSGSGRTSNEFQPCSKPCSLIAMQKIHRPPYSISQINFGKFSQHRFLNSIGSGLFLPSTFSASLDFCKKNISSGRRLAFVLLLGWRIFKSQHLIFVQLRFCFDEHW